VLTSGSLVAVSEQEAASILEPLSTKPRASAPPPSPPSRPAPPLPSKAPPPSPPSRPAPNPVKTNGDAALHGGAVAPPVRPAATREIEEISGSILLADSSDNIPVAKAVALAASPDRAIEELSGSLLLPDRSSTVGAIFGPQVAKLTLPTAPSSEIAPPPPPPKLHDLADASDDLPTIVARPVDAALAAAVLARAGHEGAQGKPMVFQSAGGQGFAPPAPNQTTEALNAAAAHAAAVAAEGAPLPSFPLSHDEPLPSFPLSEDESRRLRADPRLLKLTDTPSTVPPAGGSIAPRGFALRDQLVHDLRAIRARNPKAIPVAAALGAVVLLGLLGLVIGAVRKKGADEAMVTALTPHSALSAAAGAASAPSDPRPPATASSATPPPTEAAPIAGLSTFACTATGGDRVLSPKALVASGIEIMPAGKKLSVGFASTAKEATVVDVDPVTLASRTSKLHSADPIRRVFPIRTAKGAATLDLDRKHDALQGRRTVGVERAFDIGVADGFLAWAPDGADRIVKLWSLEGDAPVEAARVVPISGDAPDRTYALAFRRGGAIWLGALVGEAGKSLAPSGDMYSVRGLGPQLGSPAIAASAGTVLVAWADRTAATDPWGIRWMRWSPGKAPTEPTMFAVPSGGFGQDAMAPALASVEGGRFLLAWTEGPVSGHQVRAQTLDVNGAAIGAAMTFSAEGVNAGQEQVGIAADGRGLIAFMVARGKSFEVVGHGVFCPP
jgi:hypothetical protein